MKILLFSILNKQQNQEQNIEQNRRTTHNIESKKTSHQVKLPAN